MARRLGFFRVLIDGYRLRGKGPIFSVQRPAILPSGIKAPAEFFADEIPELREPRLSPWLEWCHREKSRITLMQPQFWISGWNPRFPPAPVDFLKTKDKDHAAQLLTLPLSDREIAVGMIVRSIGISQWGPRLDKPQWIWVYLIPIPFLTFLTGDLLSGWVIGWLTLVALADVVTESTTGLHTIGAPNNEIHNEIIAAKSLGKPSTNGRMRKDWIRLSVVQLWRALVFDFATSLFFLATTLGWILYTLFAVALLAGDGDPWWRNLLIPVIPFLFARSRLPRLGDGFARLRLRRFLGRGARVIAIRRKAAMSLLDTSAQG